VAARVLDPLERASEVLFGVIMVLTFTLSISVAESGRAETRAVLIGAIACNVAWGVVDAVMYVLANLTERARELAKLRATGERIEPAATIGWHPQDFLGATAVFLLVSLSTFPIVIPFVLVSNLVVALRISNAIAIAMLFAVGWRLGSYAGISGWRIGSAMVLVGLVLVAITRALGG
jgi:hypothetical protein